MQRIVKVTIRILFKEIIIVVKIAVFRIIVIIKIKYLVNSNK